MKSRYKNGTIHYPVTDTRGVKDLKPEVKDEERDQVYVSVHSRITFHTGAHQMFP